MTQVFDGDSLPDEIEAAIRERLGPVDPEVTPFRLRNRYRDGVGTWIVSVAVPTGYACDQGALAAAADALGMRIEGYFEYSGDLAAAISNDLGEPPTENELPLTNEDQSCAFCDDAAPVWVHPFEPSRTTANFEEDYTLPTFWTVCQRCESLVVEGRDVDLAQLLAGLLGESADWAAHIVGTFRAADLGGEPIADVSTPL